MAVGSAVSGVSGHRMGWPAELGFLLVLPFL